MLLHLALAALLAAALWSAGRFLETRPAMFVRAGALVATALVVWWQAVPRPSWLAGFVLVCLAALGLIEAVRAGVVFFRGRF